jgi:hypothetical protein
MKKDYKVLSKFLMLLLVGTTMSLASFGQTKISGKVTTKQGESLPGVNVIVKGTALGTTTDSNGNFNLEISDNTAVLTFSFIGYSNQEIAVGNKTEFEVSMEEDVQSLEEVVVVGYGTVKKSDLTGSYLLSKARF